MSQELFVAEELVPLMSDNICKPPEKFDIFCGLCDAEDSSYSSDDNE